MEPPRFVFNLSEDEKDGRSDAPANFAKYPAYNISSGLGVGKTAYVIKGELYLKTQVVAPNAKPHWFKAGPAPLF